MKYQIKLGQDDILWSPWYGCYQISEGCKNCFIQTLNNFEDHFNKFSATTITPGTTVLVGLNTDVFLDAADKYRDQLWETIRSYPDLIFELITKRADRIAKHLPKDWGDGWDNVILCVTAENQIRADERIPLLLDIPCKHRWITCSPMLTAIDLSSYLSTNKIEAVLASGERKTHRTHTARLTSYEWVKSLSDQCKHAKCYFKLMRTGDNFIKEETVLIENARCFKSTAAENLGLDNEIPLYFETN